MAIVNNDNSMLWSDRFNEPPVLSTPYADIDDCKTDAPDHALVWLDAHNGTYQFSTCDCRYGMQQIRQLAHGTYEVSDLCLIAWCKDGYWQDFGE